MKSPTRKQIEIINKKIKHYKELNIYGGQFTYGEILILFNFFNIKIDMDTYGWKIQYSQKKLKQGLNGQMWFYFDLK
jgi:hypothetical protein